MHPSVVDWPDTFDYRTFTIHLVRRIMRGKHESSHRECSSQSQMFQAGSKEDYSATVSKIGEPVITTMALAGETTAFEWSGMTSVSAYDLWQTQKQRSEMRKEHLDLWESTVSLTGTGRPVDGIISPVAPYPAVPHGTNR